MPTRSLPPCPACAWPQSQAPCSCPRKVGREGDREQDGDLSRGCRENASLPGLVLKRKKGSKAASPAQRFILGRAWGPGQSQTLPQRQEHKQRRLLRIRKCRDGKFQGLRLQAPLPPAPERIQVGRRQREAGGSQREGPQGHMSVCSDVTKYCLHGCKPGVSSGQCQSPIAGALSWQQRCPLRWQLLGNQAQTPLRGFQPPWAWPPPT